MKAIIKISILLFVCTLSVAFTYKANPSCLGVYGVSEQDPSKIQLTINPDNTFTYQDFSVANHIIKTSGTWVQKGNKIILKSSESKLKFHHVWTLSANGKQVKSRKGLCYYSLCKVG
jgi:uncharacterized lipoprotein YehR (DUF1307 family)